MNSRDILRAWKTILAGRKPSLSIEITRECPLRCPGCYAYEDAHLGGLVTLRQLSDHKGSDLVQKTLALVDEYKPLHLSIVGGDPLVRYRELEELLPELARRDIHVQVVTSAFRPWAESWNALPRLTMSVSIDGLQPEHDARRKPATYERILKNIAGRRATVHCTITGQMMKRNGYLEEFIHFWSAQEETVRIWMSIFTPQRGADPEESLSSEERGRALDELDDLRRRYSKLQMPESVLEQFRKPPRSPAECIFAQTTQSISADFRTAITPCQFGGDPDCERCGCFASMALAAVGAHRLAGFIPVSAIFRGSLALGRA